MRAFLLVILAGLVACGPRELPPVDKPIPRHLLDCRFPAVPEIVDDESAGQFINILATRLEECVLDDQTLAAILEIETPQ